MRHLLIATLAAGGLALAGCQSVPSAHPLPSRCDQQPQASDNNADTAGFYYDAGSRRCKGFPDQGEHNDAPFQTLGECMAACYAPAPDLMPDDAEHTSARTEAVQ